MSAYEALAASYDRLTDDVAYGAVADYLEQLLRERHAQLVASDCHDTVSRPPNLGPAGQVLRKRLGEKQWENHIRWADDLAAEGLSAARR